MKITSVECYLGTGAIGGFVTMKVNTDEGIYGWGEAGRLTVSLPKPLSDSVRILRSLSSAWIPLTQRKSGNTCIATPSGAWVAVW